MTICYSKKNAVENIISVLVNSESKLKLLRNCFSLIFCLTLFACDDSGIIDLNEYVKPPPQGHKLIGDWQLVSMAVATINAHPDLKPEDLIWLKAEKEVYQSFNSDSTIRSLLFIGDPNKDSTFYSTYYSNKANEYRYFVVNDTIIYMHPNVQIPWKHTFRFSKNDDTLRLYYFDGSLTFDGFIGNFKLVRINKSEDKE